MKPMYTTAPEDRKAPPRQLKLPPFMDDFAQLPTKGEASLIKSTFAICDTPCHPVFSYMSAGLFYKGRGESHQVHIRHM